MKKSNRFKKVILKVHEILGLATGVVVLIVSLTGCLWVFQEEIKSFSNDHTTITPQDLPFITPTKAKTEALKVLPGKTVHGTLYGQANEAVEVIFYEAEPEFYQSVFLNPYTGDLLHIENHETGFFHFILEGHMTLWMGEPIGSNIVKYSVLLFLIILVTGIVLWWPKNRKSSKQRVKFRWSENTRWRRKNFDLHAIVGFYIYLFAFALAFTGSIMAFDWFENAIYHSVGGEKETYFIVPNNTSGFSDEKTTPKAIDQLLPQLKMNYPQAVNYEIHYPHSDSASIYVEIFNKEGVYYNSDYRFYDQYTLEEIATTSVYGTYAEASISDKVLLMNYDIHVGAIGGIPGKILAFLVSLITASLPITGFLLWLGRRKKDKTKEGRNAKSHFPPSTKPNKMSYHVKPLKINSKESKASV